MGRWLPSTGMSARLLNNELQRSAPVFSALGDETRLRLVARLSGGAPLSISQLADGEAITRQAITKHLRVLATAGLVEDMRQGRERHWKLRADQLFEARRCLDLISRQWDQALLRLKAAIESADPPEE